MILHLSDIALFASLLSAVALFDCGCKARRRNRRVRRAYRLPEDFFRTIGPRP